MATEVPTVPMNIKEFNLRSGKWKTYISQLTAWFDLSDVKENKRAKYLIAVVGTDTLDLIIDLCYPKKPDQVSYNDIVSKVQNHLSPKRSELAERMCFRACKQGGDQSISEYVAQLKQLAKTCNFSGCLEENLRDQLAYGLGSEAIRFRLLTESELTFARAVEIATSLEAADRDSKATSGLGGGAGSAAPAPARDEGVHVVRASTSGGGGGGGARAPQRRRGSGAPARARCPRCLGPHHPNRCSFINTECYVCGKKGHIAKACKKRKSHSVNNVCARVGADRSGEAESEDSDDDYDVPLYAVGGVGDDEPWWRTVRVNGVEVRMQLDSGSAVSVMPYDLCAKLFKGVELLPTNIKLKMYSGQKVLPTGVLACEVAFRNKKLTNLNLVIIDSKDSPPIMGRRWMTALGIECNAMPVFGVDSEHESVAKRLACAFPQVFEPGTGKFTGKAISLSVAADARPVLCKPRPVPHALRAAVEAELQRLQVDGVLSPVETSDWGTPVVPVIKQSGEVRLCGDFKITLNPVLDDDKYPIPRIDDIFAQLQGGQLFSKIDLSHAYQQLPLTEDSKQLCVIVTHKGSFCYNRLPFGVKCAMSKFQRVLDSLFKDLNFIAVYCDDILVTGVDDNDHSDRLFTVFKILSEAGLRVAEKKCKFFQKSVSYLGYVIDAKGLSTQPEKINAVMAAPIPDTVSRLKAFLGLVNYYAKFLPNGSTVLHPLYELLKKHNKFVWTKECNNAFLKVKSMLAANPVLIHYKPDAPLRVYCDASPYGVGAVLMQRGAEGEQPVAHASRALTPPERNYAQICREGLAIVYALQKFHHYLFGRRFTLVTDCKPLAHIFNQNKSIPQMVAGRLQRWAVILSGYDYEIACVKSEQNCFADNLSRLPLEVVKNEQKCKETCEFLNFIDDHIPVDHRVIAKATQRDPILSKVYNQLNRGWEYCGEEELKPFWRVREALSRENGCIMFGYRVVVPETLRAHVLRELHAAHGGAVRTKALARSYVWWPGLNADVERLTAQCAVCTAERPAPARAPIHPWGWPQERWYRVHVDFLTPSAGTYYFVLIDAYSKWIEASKIRGTGALETIALLREIFARFGNPHELVSDNGPPFTSERFELYLKAEGVRHIRISPYKPSSNGAAENAVGLIKKCLKKAEGDNVDMGEALQTYLLLHRSTPHSTTGKSPVELMLKNNIRNRLDLLRPDTRKVVREAQRKQMAKVTSMSPTREFKVGDKVMFRTYQRNKQFWVKGTVLERLGPLTYYVRGSDGGTHKRHVDQIIGDRSGKSEVAQNDQVGETRYYGACGSNQAASPAQAPRATATPPHPGMSPSNIPKRDRRPPIRYGFE